MYFPPTILTIASHIAAAHMTRKVTATATAVTLRMRTNRDVQSAPPVLVDTFRYVNWRSGKFPIFKCILRVCSSLMKSTNSTEISSANDSIPSHGNIAMIRIVHLPKVIISFIS
ncbi:unnamed protein product [Brugia pahangi]|uniref:Secreted protein n=1 Tax=Brugia pahangi TaxID=6280 RepID=A0A0N4T8T6_BRUPA|nr:unnamed protein product [Brugia pahangi]